MDNENKIIKVGFIYTYSNAWIAGLNYLNNLLFAINSISNRKIKPVVFLGKKANRSIINSLRENAEVIQDTMFDRYSIKWFFLKFFEKSFGCLFFMEKLLIDNNVLILSHSNYTNFKQVKTISWIPDFQHIHLPEMFPNKMILFRDKLFCRLIKKSVKVILSSNDALNDLRDFSPGFTSKARVLHFVSKPSDNYYELGEKDKASLCDKYGLKNGFFYLPNQYWKHKNHMLVFKTIKLLKDQGKEIQLICTGYQYDYRNLDNVKNLKKYIKNNDLEDNIKMMGLVSRDEVYALIRFSRSVINPSLFEGWSSTVEECKSVNKEMILSDIGVHKEQCPRAKFFKRNDMKDLARVLIECDGVSPLRLDFVFRDEIKIFGEKYQNIVLEVSQSL